MSIKIHITDCPKCKTPEKLTIELVINNCFDAEISELVSSNIEIKKLIEKHIYG